MFGKLTLRIIVAMVALVTMYTFAALPDESLALPDGLTALVGLAVGFMFRDPEARGWRGIAALVMFLGTIVVWVQTRDFFQEAMLGTVFGNLFDAKGSKPTNGTSSS